MRPYLIKICLTFGALALLATGPAFAGLEKTVTPPTPLPDYNWGGFYIGASAGLVNYQAKFTDLEYFEGYDTRVLEDVSFIGGGQAGYNWQFGCAVVGLELDASGSNAEINTHTTFGNTGNPNFQEDHSKLDFLSSGRVRMGLAVQNVFVYVTGGVAVANGERNELYVDPNDSTRNTSWRVDDWRVGWTAGVGAECAIKSNWSVRLEALYDNFSESTTAGESQNTRNTRFRYQFDDELWQLRVGINYKFSSFVSR